MERSDPDKLLPCHERSAIPSRRRGAVIRLDVSSESYNVFRVFRVVAVFPVFDYFPTQNRCVCVATKSVSFAKTGVQ